VKETFVKQCVVFFK